jgi:hypothetical protein
MALALSYFHPWGRILRITVVYISNLKRTYAKILPVVGGDVVTPFPLKNYLSPPISSYLLLSPRISSSVISVPLWFINRYSWGGTGVT